MSVRDFPKIKPPPEFKDFPFDDEQMQYVDRWLALNSQQLVRQLLGFSLFTPQAATPVNNVDTVSSTSYTDASHAGPTISNLPAGTYLIVWGGAVTTTTFVAGTSGYFGPGINGADPTDTESLLVVSATDAIPAFATKALIKTFTADANTVKLRYKNASSADANTSTFGYRWMIAFRQANP